MKSYVLFVFSNKTHFETALPLLKYWQNRYHFIGIFNFSNEHYAQGLKAYMDEHESFFKDMLVLLPADSKWALLQNLLRVKAYMREKIQTRHILSSIQFIEGADIDWLVIGLLKEARIRTVVLQWAITWEPVYYDRMKKNKKISVLKRGLQCLVKSLFGLRYPTMRYLGDGAADYLLTMGAYWTEQFMKHHDRPGKFITTGNPRFMGLVTLREISNKNQILFVTGAGTSLYGYDKAKHLEDIKEVYRAYQISGSQYILIHKVHPRDKYADEIKKLATKYNNIVVETQKSIEMLLTHTILTVTIRSTVGLEALTAGSKLVVYNNANQIIGFNYAEHGLAKEVDTIETLSGVFEDVTQCRSVDQNRLERYVKSQYIIEDICDVVTQ